MSSLVKPGEHCVWIGSIETAPLCLDLVHSPEVKVNNYQRDFPLLAPTFVISHFGHQLVSDISVSSWSYFLVTFLEPVHVKTATIRWSNIKILLKIPLKRWDGEGMTTSNYSMWYQYIPKTWHRNNGVIWWHAISGGLGGGYDTDTISLRFLAPSHCCGKIWELARLQKICT